MGVLKQEVFSPEKAKKERRADPLRKAEDVLFFGLLGLMVLLATAEVAALVWTLFGVVQ